MIYSLLFSHVAFFILLYPPGEYFGWDFTLGLRSYCIDPASNPPTQRTHTQCRWLQFSVTFGVAPSSSTRLLSLSYTGIIERGPPKKHTQKKVNKTYVRIRMCVCVGSADVRSRVREKGGGQKALPYRTSEWCNSNLSVPSLSLRQRLVDTAQKRALK